MCGHLAAHKHHVAERNKVVSSMSSNAMTVEIKLHVVVAQDYLKLITKMKFVVEHDVDEELSVSSPSAPSANNRDRVVDSHNADRSAKRRDRKPKKSSSGQAQGLSILQHDLVFFVGDLNNRLDFDDNAQVYGLIQRQEWQALMARDQLVAQRDAGYAFADFVEQKITFAPTFKFTAGTDAYDKVKKRTPSFCDRILWKIKKNDDVYGDGQQEEKSVHCMRYNCAMDQRMSDHKPVYGLFQIQY